MATTRLDLRGPLNKVRPRLFDGVVARVHPIGDPLEYHTGPEHRDEVGLASIVEQLAGLPVVAAAEPDSEHPLGHPDNLIIAGAEYYEIGRVISGKVDGGNAVASIYIHDVGALNEIEDGTRELSLGYRCSLNDAKFQENFILDHLSIVPKARCGAVCSLRIDSLDVPKCACGLASSVPPAKHESVNVANMEVALKIVLDQDSKDLLNTLGKMDQAAVEIEAKKDEAAKCACNSHAIVHNTENQMSPEDKLKFDEAVAKAATLETEITTLKAASVKADEANALALNQAVADLKAEKVAAEKLAADLEVVKTDAQVKVDAAASARSDAEDKDFSARVDARVELLADATKVGIEDFKALTDRAIKVAIVKKVDEMDIEDTRSLDYVNGMYAGAMKRHAKADASVAEVREVIQANHDAGGEAAVKDIKTIEAELRAAEDAKRANKWRK